MTKLYAGFAIGDITPPLGCELFGYPQQRYAESVADPLNVRALVLRDGALTVAVVTLDWGLIDQAETAVLRDAVAAATGIDPRHVMFCASHTHTGPPTVSCWGWAIKDFAYLEAMRPRIVAAVAAAQSNLVPARVGIGVTPTDIGVSRRGVAENGAPGSGPNAWGTYDRDMTVLAIEGDDGRIVSLVHHGTHPTSIGVESIISRDWPGVMLDRIEAVTGAPAIFINGAFGDIEPFTTCGGYVGDGLPAAREVGLRAAHHAMLALRGIKEFRDLNLSAHGAGFAMPYAPLPSLSEAQTQVAARTGDAGKRGPDGTEQAYWNAVVTANADPCTKLQYQQNIVAIGPVAIVPFSGEIFSEIALRLKAASPFQHTLCAGTCNGGHGYYVTRESRARGGYEVWVSRAMSPYLFCDDIDDVLVKENLKLLRELNAT